MKKLEVAVSLIVIAVLLLVLGSGTLFDALLKNAEANRLHAEAVQLQASAEFALANAAADAVHAAANAVRAQTEQLERLNKQTARQQYLMPMNLLLGALLTIGILYARSRYVLPPSRYTACLPKSETVLLQAPERQKIPLDVWAGR